MQLSSTLPVRTSRLLKVWPWPHMTYNCHWQYQLQYLSLNFHKECLFFFILWFLSPTVIFVTTKTSGPSIRQSIPLTSRGCLVIQRLQVKLSDSNCLHPRVIHHTLIIIWHISSYLLVVSCEKIPVSSITLQRYHPYNSPLRKMLWVHILSI